MHQSGQIGVSQCCIKVEEKGWLFRAQPFNDIGIDAHMEMTDDLGQSRQLQKELSLLYIELFNKRTK